MFPSKIKPEHCPSLSSVFPELKLELGFNLFICFFKVVSFVQVASIPVVWPPPSSSSNLSSTDFLCTCSSIGVNPIWSLVFRILIYPCVAWRAIPSLGKEEKLLLRALRCWLSLLAHGAAGSALPILPRDGNILNTLYWRGLAPLQCQSHFVSDFCRKFVSIYLYINWCETSVASHRVSVFAGPMQWHFAAMFPF